MMNSRQLLALLSSLVVVAACGSSEGDATKSPSGPAPSGSAPADPVGSTKADAGITNGGTAPSRCVIDGSGVTCEHQTTTISGRTVTYATPKSAAPAAGFPTVIYFHGSFVAGDTAFAAAPSAQFGLYELTLTIKALLDRGYAVLAPNASGGSVWETNVPPFAEAWTNCSDDVFMKALFDAMSKGSFGHVDSAHLYAMGISSGGFMTSRMAISYPGKFRALADHSGSYATCSTLCNVPTPLPNDHPPILFLRGEQDMLVPATSVTPYQNALVAEGHVTKLVTDPAAGHQWLAAGVTNIPDWFDAHH